jgi:CHAT domain-containing protein
MGEYSKAEPLYRRSLEMNEAELGKDHLEVVQILNNLAELYRATARYAESERLFQRCLQIREVKLGKDHPNVADSLDGLTVLLADQGRWQGAADLAERERRGVARHVAHVLSALTDKDQLQFLDLTDRTKLRHALSLSLEDRSDQKLAAFSAGWLLNGKALAQQSLAERALLARTSTDPATKELATGLTDVRRQLAALSLAPAREGMAEERQQAIAQLGEQEQELSKRLGQAVGRIVREDPWLALDELRRALPENGVFIDLARFNVASFKVKAGEKQWLGDHYVAWVVPAANKGEVQVVDLGEAETIEKAVADGRKAWRALPQDPAKESRILEVGEPQAEKELAESLQKLSQLVLEPILKHAGSYERWYVSPDGALWLAPWAALPLADGHYLIEKYRLSYLVSGRELVVKPPSAQTSRPVGMADPDYDLGLDVARAQVRDLKDNAPAELRGLRSSRLALGKVPRLPGTALEAQAIKPALKKYAGEEPWIYKDKQALEGYFKAFKSPKVLMLATHGYFLEDQEVKLPENKLQEEPRGPVLTKDGTPVENPLLRCGLLLAGCNNREQAQEGDEDGVLTGLEIVGTDLRGTELVVLSACETGLGTVRNGEGVAGLRQAFQLAGAHAVVATLWQIPDKESAQLMTAFFENLAAGKSKCDALRDAQLKMIEHRRQRSGAAHPFFWAAYTLTGE